MVARLLRSCGIVERCAWRACSLTAGTGDSGPTIWLSASGWERDARSKRAQVAEWLMAADCKSAAPCELRRFESSPVHQVFDESVVGGLGRLRCAGSSGGNDDR